MPKGNHDYIKRVLDAGAWGIVVPMVDTVEQAQIAIRAAKYPPVGNRSLGGGMHSLNFDAPVGRILRPAPTTKFWSSCKPKAPPAWPTPRRFTPCPASTRSLSARSTCGPTCARPTAKKPRDDEFEAMLQRVVDIGKKTGTPTGMHTMEPDAALARAKQGMQFIAIGSELRMMTQRARKSSAP